MKLHAIAISSLIISSSSYADTYVIPLRNLKFEKASEELKLKLEEKHRYEVGNLYWTTKLNARTPDGVEAFLAPDSTAFKMDEEDKDPFGPEQADPEQADIPNGDTLIAFDVKANQPFTGILDFGESKSYRFSFDPKNHKPTEKEAFDVVRKTHYYLLSHKNIIGKPWFNIVSRDLKLDNKPQTNLIRVFSLSDNDFSLFTSEQTISDNLALDRDLQLMGNDLNPTVDISSIQGIKVKPIDWKKLLPANDVKVAIDPLAMLIPEDQHVLICPSLAHLNKAIDLVEKESSPLGQTFSVRNPFRTLPTRYKKQMGLNFPSALAKLVPAKSVAITGYDPFFSTGTDIAVLFESDDPDTLLKMLKSAIKSKQSHVAKVRDTVVVTNSMKQLERIQQVEKKNIQSLGSLDEYKFFRHRYPIANASTGFVFLSDACIRRWGGPTMRIAASRRTKSIAALNHLTATQILFSKDTALLVDNEKLSDDHQFLLGKVTTNKGLVTSEKMGNLHWLTPSIEMDLSKVTKTEATAYGEWRKSYDEGWAKVFDPIGFSFNIDDDTKELDLTVMPLSTNNSYKELIQIVGNSVLSREAKIATKGEVIMASLAIDKNCELLQGLKKEFSGLSKDPNEDPLSWMGSSLTAFVEQDARWQLNGSRPRGIFNSFILGAPIGVIIEQKNKLKLEKFLKYLNAEIYKASILMKRVSKKHGQFTYTILTPNWFVANIDDFKICYAVTDSSLIITMDPQVLKRALDRGNHEHKMKLSSVQENADHLYINADSRTLMSIMSNGKTISDKRRVQSFRAIPILNEWRKLWRDKAPSESHFQRFGEDIYCPGGKGYHWNPEEMTMESAVYGHPTNPKDNPDDNTFLNEFGKVESSIKFENDGLRVRLKMRKSEPLKAFTVVSPGTKLLGKLDFPTKPGTKWKYDISINEHIKEHKGVESFENISFLNGRVVQHFNLQFLSDNQLKEDLTSATYQIDSGIRLESIESRDLERPMKLTQTPALMTYPAELRSGYKVIQKFKSKWSTGQTFETTSNTQILGTEDVAIAGKTYKDCIIVKVDFFSNNEKFTDEFHAKYWIKTNLGTVKYHEVRNGQIKTGKLKSFTVPSE